MVEQIDVWGVGVVSLITLDELRAAGHAQRQHVDALAHQEAELAARAEDRMADAGALLVPRREWWPVPSELVPHIVEADRLVPQIARLQGGSGWLRRQRLSRASARLREILLEVARVGGEAGVGVPDVEPVLEEAADLYDRAAQVQSALQAELPLLTQLDHEIALRDDAYRHLGFDSLHLAAHIRAYGVPVVQSPFELARDETAHLAVDAALAQPVAMAAPQAAAADGAVLAHTGVHHWVGAFRSGAAPVAGPPVDTGVLVVTSSRIVFVGHATSAAVALDAMLAMDIFTDGLAVLQLGREVADVFLVQEPRLVAFYANWVAERG